MSKRKIISALSRKNITPVSIKFVRGCPTPSGYANGYDLEFHEDLEDIIYELDTHCDFSSYMEFDDINAVLVWIGTLPIVVKGG